MGGMWADTLLDFLQMFFTAGGIALVFFYVLDAVGGWQGMLTDAHSMNVSNPFTLLPVAGDQGYLGYSGTLGWMYWLAAWMSLGLGSIACQDLMQRSMSARNEATSVWGTYFAAALYFVFGIMSPLVGIMMYKLAQNCAKRKIPIECSLERFMKCGTGVCGQCAVDGLLVCKDGPVFSGETLLKTRDFGKFHRGPSGKLERL